VLFAGACDGTAGTTSTSPQGTGSTPTESVSDSQPVQEGGVASDGERFRTDGLTFVYPTEVYSSAAEQPSSGTTTAVAVDLAGPSPERDGEVIVTMVRSAEGLELGALSDDDRALLARLESLEAETRPIHEVDRRVMPCGSSTASGSTR
jgi:hypothetical protein